MRFLWFGKKEYEFEDWWATYTTYLEEKVKVFIKESGKDRLITTSLLKKADPEKGEPAVLERSSDYDQIISEIVAQKKTYEKKFKEWKSEKIKMETFARKHLERTIAKGEVELMRLHIKALTKLLNNIEAWIKRTKPK